MADKLIGNLEFGDHGTASYYDGARRLGLETGLRGVLPIGPGSRVVAPAFTLKFGVASRPPASPLNFYDVIAAAPKGHVVVAEVGADRWVLGSNVSRFAELSGMAGLVLDGCVRDIEQIRRRGYPIFARGPSVTSYATDLVFCAAGEAIVCGGVPVATGDVVIGDDDGVVCLPASRLEDILHQVEDIVKLDLKLGNDIEARRPLSELHESRLRWPVRR